MTGQKSCSEVAPASLPVPTPQAWVGLADLIRGRPVRELAKGRGAQKGRAGGGEQVLSVQGRVQGLQWAGVLSLITEFPPYQIERSRLVSAEEALFQGLGDTKSSKVEGLRRPAGGEYSRDNAGFVLGRRFEHNLLSPSPSPREVGAVVTYQVHVWEFLRSGFSAGEGMGGRAGGKHAGENAGSEIAPAF